MHFAQIKIFSAVELCKPCTMEKNFLKFKKTLKKNMKKKYFDSQTKEKKFQFEKKIIENNTVRFFILVATCNVLKDGVLC